MVAITPWPPARTGLAFYSAELYQHLSRKGVQVTILALGGREEKKGILIRHVKGAFQLLREALRLEGDVYHIQYEYLLGGPLVILLMPLLVVLLKRKARIVLTVHGLVSKRWLRHLKRVEADSYYMKVFQTFSALFYFLLKIYVGQLCRAVSKVVVHTSLMKQVLVREYGVPEGKVVVVPHGTRVMNRSGSSDSKTVLFWGFLRPSKGIEYLVEAVHKIRQRDPSVKLMIVGGVARKGDVKYAKRIIELIRKLGEDGIELRIGHCPEEELEELIEQSAVAALPYVDYFVETSGVVSTLLAHGKPIVCTKIPRFSELKHGIHCLKAKPRDVEDLADKLERLLRDRVLREKLSANAKKEGERRYWSVLAEEYMRIYSQI